MKKNNTLFRIYLKPTYPVDVQANLPKPTWNKKGFHIRVRQASISLSPDTRYQAARPVPCANIITLPTVLPRPRVHRLFGNMVRISRTLMPQAHITGVFSSNSLIVFATWGQLGDKGTIFYEFPISQKIQGTFLLFRQYNTIPLGALL